jgi:hypothetical protein
MSNLKNKLQHLIEGQIPEYLRVSYPKYAEFLKEYYKFLDENRQANSVLLNSNSWTDVDLTLDLFVEEMRKQHAYDISPDALVEQRRFIKFINQYYESKGTENAAELFFRMMYNDNVTIKYPGDYVLRASDGIWQSKKTLKIDTDYTQINPDSLDIAPAPLRENASDVFSLAEKTIYLKYNRKELTGLNQYSKELGCIHVGRILTNKDIFELEIDVPKATNIDDLNKALATLAYYDTVWVTAFDNGVEYVYGFLTQQLVGYEILSGGENFRRRDTFTVEVEESALYPIPGQENNNGLIRVTNITTNDVEEYFASDYVLAGAEYSASDITGIINDFRFISTGHRFDITGDYFAEMYNEDDDYTTYKDFVRVFENPRGSRYTTLVTGDYFAEREDFSAYMEYNDDRGYTDFNEDIYNLSSATVRFEVGYVYEHPGQWKNNAGFLSDINKLQDNYYYQPFSYVIQTRNTPYEQWNALYKNSAHPAGFIVFGELLVEDNITFNPVNITSRQYVISNFVENVQPVDNEFWSIEKPLVESVQVGNSYAPEYFAELYADGETFGWSYFKTITEEITITDEVNKSLNSQPVFSNTVDAEDALTKTIGYNLTDSVSVSDNASLQISYIREFADDVTQTDILDAQQGVFPDELLAISDESNFNLSVVHTDTVVVVDTLIKDIDLTIDGTESYSPQYFAEDYASENVVSINDTVIVDGDFESISDNNVVTDELVNTVGKVISDTIEISEDAVFILDKDISETVTISEALAKTVVVNYADDVNVVDDISFPGLTLPEQDETQVTDVLSASINKPINETVDVDDSPAKTVTHTKSETLVVSDNAVVVPLLNDFETVITNDGTIVTTISKSLADSVSIVDVLNIGKTYAVGEIVVVSDAYAGTLDKTIVTSYSDDYFECPTYASDELITLTDTIYVVVDNYIATGYVDNGYSGDIASNTDVTNEC